jgi:putative ABC transport system permease protein
VILVAIRGLLGRKLRAALTAIAVVLGVAMISGTYVLTDTIQTAFDRIFTESYRGTDAVVTARTAFEPSVEGDTGFVQETLPESMLERTRRVEGVDAALGGVAGLAQIVDRDGDVLTTSGAPALGFSIDATQPRFESLTLAEGRWPAPNEVAIDEASYKKADFRVGETIRVAAYGPARRMRLSGVVRFGALSSLGGATIAAMELRTAQLIFDKEGRLDQIRVAAESGVTRPQLIANLRRQLGTAVRVRSVGAQADRDARSTNEFIGFLQNFLLAFAGIALFVGAFVISNTFSITIAQRTREFATIRTIGGSRRQVLASVIIEALVIGALASVTGLFLGFLLARGLNALFDAVGFDLPKVGLVYAPRTIIVALLVGIAVTLLASLRPALRATRVPPIAAVREGATLPESRFAHWRTPGALLLAALGVGALLFGLFKDGLGTIGVLAWLGVGALALFSGVALFASRIVRPLADAVSPVGTVMVAVFSVLFYPILIGYWLLRYGLFEQRVRAAKRLGAFVLGVLLTLVIPILTPIALAMWLVAKLGWYRPEWPVERPGVIADVAARGLARENAQRNPQRTASTASALMIGLALVTLVAVLAQGIRTTFLDSVDQQFIADYAITAQDNFSPLPVEVETRTEEVDGTSAVSGIRFGQARIDGDTQTITGVDADLTRTIDVDWVAGDDRVPAQLGDDGAFVREDWANDRDLGVGSRVRMLTPSGATLDLRIRGIFDEPTGGSPFGNVNISTRAFDENYEQPTNAFTFANMRGGVTEANTRRLEQVLGPAFPNAKVQDREEFKDNQISGLTAILNILYVLLALSVIVSLFGIINTLALSVFERTRELGLLRAIGMTRRQVRRMIRQESVVTALIGAVLGIILGIALGVLLVARIDFIEFSLPTVTLIIVALAAILVGIIAAIMPARRASRLNVLQALQYE